MAKAYSISGSYGVILADSGAVIPVGSEGPIELEDRDTLLQILLAAAVELNYLRGLGPGVHPGFADGPDLIFED